MDGERRRAALDLTAVVGCGAVALWSPVVALLAALAVGSVARRARGAGWSTGQPVEPWHLVTGLAVGVVALGLGVVAADPVVTAGTGRSVEWSQVTAVRGQLGSAIVLGLLVTAQAVAFELVLRRWLLDATRAATKPAVAIAVTAVAEGWLVGGSLGARAGAIVTGIACGWLYVASGGRLATSIAARVTFELGVVAVVWLRLV